MPATTPTKASLMPCQTTSLRMTRSIGAESHADAHLLGALRDRIGHQAVDADGGKQQRHRAEYGKQQHVEALSRRGASHHLVHGADMGHRKSAAGDAQLFGDCGNRRVRVAMGSHQPEERLDIGIGGVIVIRNLGDGNDHHGVGRLGQAAVVEVGDDADNRFDSSLPPFLPVVEVLPYWVFVGEELPGEGLIDQGYAGRAGVVVFREVASTQNGDLEQAQIARRNAHILASAAVLFDRTPDDVESRAIFDIDGPPESRPPQFPLQGGR